ncbi:MAG: hypothetical protein U0797_07935 [Gemmataceae bacterium]
MLRTWTISSVGFAALTLLVAGCQNGTDPKPEAKNTKPADAKATADGEHGHKPGQHGGTIVEIGRDNFHAEAVFGDKGLVRLFMLAKDEAQIQEVESQTLTAYAKAEGDTNAAEFKLEPRPRPDDAKGRTSVFEGTLPAELHGKRLEVTVTTIRIEGGRFRFAFKNFKEGQHAAMPAAVTSEKAKKLYLTPGGKYTEADIKANGGVTARQKFGDEMAEHDMHPKKGDKICPITDTKANSKFAWVVGGKSYEFCCPPCIDEFVKMAKEKPEQIKEPGAYVKQ